MTSRRNSQLLFLAAFAVAIVAIHVPFLTLPFHWDEQGQFVPASLDLYRDGAWVTHSTIPNLHPPGVMAALAAVWTFTGYSIVSTRVAMLAIAALGAFFSFLLAIRLGRGTAGAPAFAAVFLLFASPLFYTQSMMAQLDVPAMTLSVLTLLLFLQGRYFPCAVAATAAVLMKETAIVTPMVLAAWLLWMPATESGHGVGVRWKALYFLLPAAALGIWMTVLHGATGFWLGNPEFAAYNIGDSLTPMHIARGVARRCYFLFIGDGHWIGSIALLAGWPLLRSRNWAIALTVAGAQIVSVTLFGGALLERYLLPSLPIYYAAVAVAASVYRPAVRIASHGLMIGLMLAGWFYSSPHEAAVENNLAMVDFVRLQRDAAHYLESYGGDQTIATAWPLTRALTNPDFGYLRRPLPVAPIANQTRAALEAIDLDRVGIVVLFARSAEAPGLLKPFRIFAAPPPQATARDLAQLGFRNRARWVRGRLWLAIYTRDDRAGRGQIVRAR